jgi:hypothetical protein
MESHKKTPFVAILKMSFVFLLQNWRQEGRTGPVWVLVPVGGERVWGKGVGGWI